MGSMDADKKVRHRLQSRVEHYSFSGRISCVLIRITNRFAAGLRPLQRRHQLVIALQGSVQSGEVHDQQSLIDR